MALSDIVFAESQSSLAEVGRRVGARVRDGSGCEAEARKDGEGLKSGHCENQTE